MTGGYYGNVNPDLLRWAPLSAHDVLEIGCGAGALAAAYRRRNPRVRYTGIEGHGPAAEAARAHVDRLVEADFLGLSEADLTNLGQFDAVLMGDVLEHMPDPWEALRRVRGRLRAEGWLTLSVPNVAHWSVLAEIMSGRWPAHESGLFDRTHLRWFTLHSLQETLATAGFTMARTRARNFVLDEAKAKVWVPALAGAAKAAGVEPAGFLQRAHALQWVANARPSGAPSNTPELLHVHFAAITPDFLDVRMRQPAEALASDATLNVTYAERNVALPVLARDKPKVAVVQRLPLASPDVARRYVAEAEDAGWVLAFEIDDHPELIGQVQRSDVGQRLLHAIRAFHAVQTSTPQLAQALSNVNPHVQVFRNALFETPAARRSRAERLRVFHGALNREGFSARVAGALAPLAAERSDVEFVVMHDRAFFDALPTTAKTLIPASSYAAYLQAMADSDIVLSPLEGAPAELHKSDIKFLEAGGCGAVMLASRPVYGETMEDGRTGLIADALDDWPRQLRRLIEDGDLRASLAKAAGDYVREERMQAHQVAKRADWLRGLWRDQARLMEDARRRVQVAAAP